MYHDADRVKQGRGAVLSENIFLSRRTWWSRATLGRRIAAARSGQTNVSLSRQGRQAHRGGNNEGGFENHLTKLV